MISIHYDNKLKFVSANIHVRRGLMIQNGVKIELKFRGLKMSTKITKIKTPQIFNVYGIMRFNNDTTKQ